MYLIQLTDSGGGIKVRSHRLFATKEDAGQKPIWVLRKRITAKDEPIMRIFALQLNNDIKGIEKRKKYIEDIIAALPNPDFVVLPELVLCSYMASQEIWKYADSCGRDTSDWAIQMAQKYDTYVGVGFLDREDDNFYNRYLIAGKEKVYGVVTKSEGESAVFKRGDFGNIIITPFGKVAVAICYDAKRKHFYDNIKNEEISLILFPHGCPADPKKSEEEQKNNDFFCGCYEKAYGVPVVYVNSIGKLEDMPGKMGAMMKKAGFSMNGKSKIYECNNGGVSCGVEEAIGADIEVKPQTRKQDIRFYGKDLVKGNWLFRVFVLGPDVKYGVKLYNENHRL